MQINSIADLFLHINEPHLAQFHELYELEHMPAVRLIMNDRGWADTKPVMGDNRGEVEDQTLFILRERLAGHEVIYNPIRSRRAAPPKGPDPVDLIEQERMDNSCKWCEEDGWLQPNLWADDFGQAWSSDSRFVAQANRARLAPISGVVFGDHRAHNHLTLSLNDFLGMFQVAESYIARAREARPDVKSFIIFMNGGPKAAASISHAHLQIVGRQGSRYFGYAENILSRCGSDYWKRVGEVHTDLGLTLVRDQCASWVNVVPVRDRDISIASPSIIQGAVLAHSLLQVLIRQGTSNYSLAAFLTPEQDASSSDHCGWKWPTVLWRLVDRGDMRTKHSDVGAMELFGSSVVATDPFDVARWIKSDIAF
jgi:hypothetical protein